MGEDAGDVGALEVGAVDVGAVDVGAVEVGAVEVGAVDVDAVDVGAVRVGAEVGPAVGPEVGAVVGAFDGDRLGSETVTDGRTGPVRDPSAVGRVTDAFPPPHAASARIMATPSKAVGLVRI